MSEDKSPEELFEALTTDTGLTEKLKEATAILRGLGADKDGALSFLIGYLAANYDNLNNLVGTLELIKLSYMMSGIQPMMLVSSGELVLKDRTESEMKPV